MKLHSSNHNCIFGLYQLDDVTLHDSLADDKNGTISNIRYHSIVP